MVSPLNVCKLFTMVLIKNIYGWEKDMKLESVMIPVTTLIYLRTWHVKQRLSLYSISL